MEYPKQGELVNEPQLDHRIVLRLIEPGIIRRREVELRGELKMMQGRSVCVKKTNKSAAAPTRQTSLEVFSCRTKPKI